MTRAERRRLEKQSRKKKKTYVMTDEELAKRDRETAEKAIMVSMNLMIGIPLLAMRDLSKWSSEKDWGKKRLTKFSDEILTRLNDVQNGVISLEDINQVLHEETGIELNYKAKMLGQELYKGEIE